MNITISKDELTVEQVKRLLTQFPQSEIFVEENHQPQFAILSMTRYRNLTAIQSNASAPSPSVRNAPTTPPPEPSEKIGELVQRVFRAYSERDSLPQEEIDRLCDLEYSKRTFIVPYPILQLRDPSKTLSQQKRDANGYNRYYNYELTFHGAQYILCCHWTVSNRRKFEEWMSRWNGAETPAATEESAGTR